MQNFLPLADFEASARALDYRRLGKQRVEAWQILRALTDPAYGWQHHPAVAMWRGYEKALTAYYAAICREWVRRGYRHTMTVMVPEPLTVEDMPPWFGDPAFHFAHKSKLHYKAPEQYAQWAGIPVVEYVWPHVQIEGLS